MKGYEAIFVTDAGLAEAALQEVLDKLKNIIIRYEGEVKSHLRNVLDSIGLDLIVWKDVELFMDRIKKVELPIDVVALLTILAVSIRWPSIMLTRRSRKFGLSLRSR